MEMINLLPPEEKKQLAASRSNSLLLRYCFFLAFAVGLLVFELFGMSMVVDAGVADNKAVIDYNQQQTSSYSETKKQATAFTQNLSTAKSILSNQVPYSTILLKLAENLPAGAIVQSVTIDPATFGTTSVLQVKAKSSDIALAVKGNLQKIEIREKTPLFTEVGFQSLGASATANDSYPFTASYAVKFSKAVITK